MWFSKLLLSVDQSSRRRDLCTENDAKMITCYLLVEIDFCDNNVLIYFIVYLTNQRSLLKRWSNKFFFKEETNFILFFSQEEIRRFIVR